MCSSSSSSSSVGRSDVFRNYRFVTADKSQVCDGRNLESVRTFRSAEPPKNASKEVQGDGDKNNGLERSVIDGIGKGYRPTSSRHSKKRNNEKRQQDVTQGSQERQQPSTKPMANSFLPDLMSLGSDHTLLDDSWHQKSTEEKKRQPSSEEEGNAVKKERSDESESRDNTESRPGSQTRRRSSAGGSVASSGGKVTMRKLSEPMHRCSYTNASVNGIMRPARYSSTNLSGMVDLSSGMVGSSSSDERIRKCTSQVALRTFPTKSTSSIRLSGQGQGSLSTRRSLDVLTSTKPRRTMSVADMANENWSIPPSPVDQEAKDRWVASGVAFSKNMEVYVFKK